MPVAISSRRSPAASKAELESGHLPYLKLEMENKLAIKVTIWNEGRHEKLDPNVTAVYPNGIHAAISAGLENEGFAIRCGSLDDPDEGLG